MSCELDCTPFCRLLEHGNMLTKCLTKREISEDKLISFLVLTCANFSRNIDDHVRKLRITWELLTTGSNLINCNN